MRPAMKMIVISAVALSLAGPIAVPSFASDVPTTQPECEKAGMKWKLKANKCEAIRGKKLSQVEKGLGLIGIACMLLALYLLWKEGRSRSSRGDRGLDAV